jgi:hypothetical protein
MPYVWDTNNVEIIIAEHTQYITIPAMLVSSNISPRPARGVVFVLSLMGPGGCWTRLDDPLSTLRPSA